ncbi:MAG: hypothetical protein IPI68_11390 [Chitinophagaceae bacterium]|nr:hypothetical protein [Chitinophagaceae bacterium]
MDYQQTKKMPVDYCSCSLGSDRKTWSRYRTSPNAIFKASLQVDLLISNFPMPERRLLYATSDKKFLLKSDFTQRGRTLYRLYL